MSKIVKGALIVIGLGTVISVVVHRRAIAAMVNGTTMPEPPAWHYTCGLHKKEA